MTILYSWDYDEEFEPAQSYIWSVYYLDLDAHNINLGNNIGLVWLQFLNMLQNGVSFKLHLNISRRLKDYLQILFHSYVFNSLLFFL